MKFAPALALAALAAATTPAAADSARWEGFTFGASFSAARVSGGGTGGSTRPTYGLSGGYNWALSETAIVGVSANMTTLGGSGGGGGGPNIRRAADLRLTAGYAMDAGMIYASVGAAQGRFGSSSTNHDGTVVAVGFQQSLSDNLSFRFEYAFHRFEPGGGGGPGPGTGNPQTQSLTVGLVFTH